MALSVRRPQPSSRTIPADAGIAAPPSCNAWTGAPIAGDPALRALMAAVEFVQPGPDAAERAGRWRQEARRRGRVLSLSDALIAAAAEGDATVLTRNLRDFDLTPVRVETY